MRRTLVLGLDLGGTKIAAGVVEASGSLLSSLRIATPASGVKADIGALFDAAHSAVVAAKVPWKAIRSVGVGVPGAADPKTQTVWAPNLPGWNKVPLKRLLEKAFGRPVFVEGDRNAQALAEIWLGDRRGQGRVQNLVFLTVGTGIGAGLISDGRLICGARGVSGAAGWLAVSENWQPEFGRLGCLEALAAGPALPRLVGRRLRKGDSTLISSMAQGEGGKINAEIVAAAARHGDFIACRAIKEVGTNLGRGVASIVSLLNPELVVLGGGLAEAGELILKPLRRAARQWGQPLASRQVRIVRSRLGEYAGVLGAARYALLKLEQRRSRPQL